jgi:2-dehydro-3-deoxyphosphogluconate aldolase / (4S)-4-hydroxy-2-oxoglutarate aldolase
MNYDKLLAALTKSAIMPVFRSHNLLLWRDILDVVHDSGISVMEYQDGREPLDHKIFPLLVEYVSRFPNFQLGVSTTGNVSVCREYLKAGASFVYSPFLNHEVADLCSRHDAAWVPGCFDHTDIIKALEYRTSVISVLPGPLAASPEAIHGAFNQLKFIPSSGIDLKTEKIQRWINAGALCIRRGPTLFHSSLLSVRDWPAMMRRIKHDRSVIRECRSATVSSVL